MRPAFSTRVIERANLPDPEKEILLRALGSPIVVISHRELECLNAAINALPTAERVRIDQATEAAMILAMSEADLGI